MIPPRPRVKVDGLAWFALGWVSGILFAWLMWNAR
jgi:hypothetical protein